MLLQIGVENFKSIDDRITLTLVASKEEHHPSFIQRMGSFAVLPTALIVGPNGAGKSNLFQAIKVLQGFLKGKYSHSLPYRPHRMDTSKVSHIDLQFIHNGSHYAYLLEYNKEEIVREYLILIEQLKKTVLFQRNCDNLIVKGNTKTIPIDQSALYTLKSDPLIQGIHHYLTGNIVIALTGQDEDLYGETIEAMKDEANREMVSKLIKRLDIGIEGLVLRDEELFVHYESLDIPLEEESTGTKRLIMLLGLISDVLQDGKIVIIDELERNLHTLLTTTIVRLFNSPKTNRTHAQMICSSHNTHLLDLNLFRQDQIWFMEKDRQTLQTELYSLYNIADVLEDENIEFGYVEGKYGATFEINFAEVTRDDE